MLQKGYKRKAKGMALLQCIIGLIVLIIVVLLLYFALTMDYSDRLQEGAQIRSYVPVAATVAPTSVPVASPTEHETPEPTSLEPSDAPRAAADPTAEVQQTAETPLENIDPAATDEQQAAVIPTMAPSTPEPTEAPTATPEPAAEATKVPTGLYAPMQPVKGKMPSLTTKDVELGITKSARSAADNAGVLYLAGYAYIDRESVDAAAIPFKLVIISSSNSALMVDVNRVEGISGVSHDDAECQNASSADFEAYIDVSNFPDDVYYLGIVFNNNGSFVLSQFPGKPSFSMVNHRVLADVPTVTD